jgi:acetyltransferase-like isoleucine patch superfamily enzyme
VVTRALPDDVIAGGNPAKVLKRRDPETKLWV